MKIPDGLSRATSAMILKAPKTLHPMHPLVVEVFDKVGKIDRPKLANEFTGSRITGHFESYCRVANDVIVYMFHQGYLEQDEMGWMSPTQEARDVLKEK